MCFEKHSCDKKKFDNEDLHLFRDINLIVIFVGFFAAVKVGQP